MVQFRVRGNLPLNWTELNRGIPKGRARVSDLLLTMLTEPRPSRYKHASHQHLNGEYRCRYVPRQWRIQASPCCHSVMHRLRCSCCRGQHVCACMCVLLWHRYRLNRWFTPFCITLAPQAEHSHWTVLAHPLTCTVRVALYISNLL
jgi:hypothetical protein